MALGRESAVQLALAALLFACLAVAPAAAEEDTLAMVKRLVAEHPLVMFSKSYCPYCRRAKATFSALGVLGSVHILELDQRSDGPLIQDALEEFVGRRSVPQVFVGGQHIGGSDDTVEAHESGKLKDLVSAALGRAEL